MALPVGRKVLLDTNVFIDFLRAERHADWVFGGKEQVIRFVSAVVLMELYLGADTPKRKRAVEQVVAAFPTSRVIAPASSLYPRAGMLFRRLFYGTIKAADRLGPMNDLLIALTAREIGAAVVTNNVSEFSRIAEQVPGLEILAPSEPR